MNNQIINITELVRLYEHDKDAFTELMYRAPYNNKSILVEVIRRLIGEISDKNNMIEQAKKDIKYYEEQLLKIRDYTNNLNDELNS